MSVTREQILDGISGYLHDEILPKMGQDKALQIGLAVAANMVKNGRLVDAVFENGMIMALLEENEDGEYEIDGLLDGLKESMEMYGALPLEIPAIPLIAPRGATIKLNAADIGKIRQRIEAEEGI